MVMVDGALPKLLEDGSKLDWPDAEYSADVRLGDGFARVAHHLANAPALERLIAEGGAHWAVELRCPRTLLARVETATAREMEVRWDASEVDDLVYLIPGLLATRDVSLGTEGLGALWAGDTLDVPGGWWLARGTERRTSTLRESLLSFDEDSDLPPGGMRVEPDSNSGRPRFIVYVASDIRAAVERDRSMQVAGLTGVCALFPRVFDADAEAEYGALIGEIRDRLEDAGAPTWEDPDQYDPARAATAIECFLPPQAPPEEIDDE